MLRRWGLGAGRRAPGTDPGGVTPPGSVPAALGTGLQPELPWRVRQTFTFVSGKRVCVCGGVRVRVYERESDYRWHSLQTGRGMRVGGAGTIIKGKAKMLNALPRRAESAPSSPGPEVLDLALPQPSEMPLPGRLVGAPSPEAPPAGPRALAVVFPSARHPPGLEPPGQRDPLPRPPRPAPGERSPSPLPPSQDLPALPDPRGGDGDRGHGLLFPPWPARSWRELLLKLGLNPWHAGQLFPRRKNAVNVSPGIQSIHKKKGEREAAAGRRDPQRRRLRRGISSPRRPAGPLLPRLRGVGAAGARDADNQ